MAETKTLKNTSTEKAVSQKEDIKGFGSMPGTMTAQADTGSNVLNNQNTGNTGPETTENTTTEKTGTETGEKKKGFGTMPGALTSEGDAGADVLNTKNSTGSSGNVLSNYTEKNTNQTKFSGYDPLSEIPDAELITMLHDLYYFDTYFLKHYYYDNDISCQSLGYDFVINYYNPLFFGDKMVTQAHIDEFYARIKKAGDVEKYKQSVGEYYAKKVGELDPYLNKPNLLDRVKNDGDLLLKKTKKADELKAVKLSIENEDQKEFNTIVLKSRQLNLTQADADRVPVLKTKAENFLKLCDGSDASLKSCFADDYNTVTRQIADYTTFLSYSAEKVKKSNDKKNNAGNNPLPSGDGSYYKTPRKKPGKEDNPNKRSLKRWGVYKQTEKEKAGGKKGEKEKVDEYSIYKKDKEGKDADEIDMNDAVQGALGDCYLISSIAAVARRRPDMVKSLIAHTPGESAATVTLHLVNPNTQIREARKTKVNFYFPINSLEPGYAQAGDQELWVMIIEKAYAQEMGGYDNIVGNSPAEALAVLTGVEPTETGTDKNNLVEQLKTANDHNTAMVAGTKEETEIKALGDPRWKIEYINNSPIVRLASGEEIYPKHAYTILEYDESKDRIKVRNPHGDKTINYEVTTFYGEKTPMSETFKAEFSITLEEFKACFSAIYSAKLN